MLHTWQFNGSLIILNSVQNGVPEWLLMNQEAAILPNLVIPDLKPAKPKTSLGSCELTSHSTYLSHCGVWTAYR